MPDSFLIKLQASCNFIKKESLAQVFSCKFCEISKNTFFTEHLWATASGKVLQAQLSGVVLGKFVKPAMFVVFSIFFFFPFLANSTISTFFYSYPV